MKTQKEKTNREYEYSFNVDSLQNFVVYALANEFVLTDTSKQIRMIYRKKDFDGIARITINERDGVPTQDLDVKIGGDPNALIKDSIESLPLVFEDLDAAQSLLQLLGFDKEITLVRTRHVYTKDDVSFELDEYTEPKISCVVAIEGNQEKVDKLYQQVKNL